MDGVSPTTAQPAPARIDYGILENQIGFWIRRTNVRVLESFSSLLGEFNLRPVEVTILVLLDNNVGLTQVALGSALDTDQSTMVSLLTRLEQRKLVTRKRLSTDRRFQVTALTAAGRRMLLDVERRLIEHNESLLARLSKPERNTLIELLRRLAID